MSGNFSMKLLHTLNWPNLLLFFPEILSSLLCALTNLVPLFDFLLNFRPLTVPVIFRRPHCLHYLPDKLRRLCWQVKPHSIRSLTGGDASSLLGLLSEARSLVATARLSEKETPFGKRFRLASSPLF